MNIRGKPVGEGDVTLFEALEEDPKCAQVEAFHVAVDAEDGMFCGIVLEGHRNDIKIVMDVSALCAFLDLVMDVHTKYDIPLSIDALSHARAPDAALAKQKPRSDN